MKKARRKNNKYEPKIEAVLDLHEKTKKEAEELIINFLKDSKKDKKRKIQIITGKGIHSEEGRSVLRPFVANILKEKRIKFESSKINEGGTGAFNIFLE